MSFTKGLILLILAPFLILLGLGGLSYVQIRRISREAEFMAENVAPSLAALSHASHDVAEIMDLLAQMAAMPTREGLDDATRRMEVLAAHGLGLLRRYRATLVADERDEALIQGTILAFERLSSEVVGELQSLPSDSMTTAVQRVPARIQGAYRGVIDALDATLDYNEALMAKAQRGARSDADRAIRLHLVAILSTLCVCLGAAVGASLRIVRPIRGLAGAVEALGSGDLGTDIPFLERPDEAGALARSIDRLKRTAVALEVQHRTKESLASIITALQGCEGPEQFGAELLGRLLPILGARGGTMALRDGDSWRFDPVAVQGTPRGDLLTGDPAWWRAQLDRTQKGGRGPTPWTMREYPAPGTILDRQELKGTRGQALVLPLVSGTDIPGIVVVDLGRDLEERDVDLIEAVLPVAPVMLESVRRLVSTVEQARALGMQQEAMRSSEEWFRQVIASAPGGIVVVGDGGRIVLANPQAERILGYAAGELVGKEPESMLPEAACALHRTVRDDGRSAETDAVASHSGEARRKDGSRVPLDLELSRMREVAGRPRCTCIAFRDVTARLAAEMEMRKLSEAIRQFSASVMVTDLAGNIEYVNPHFERLTGYTSAEVLGRNPRFLKTGRMAPAVYSELWRTLCRGEVWRGELENRKKNGEAFVESVVISPVMGADGRPSHYVAIKDDITERTRFEKLLRFNREVIERAGPMMWVDPRDGSVVYANEAALDHLGYTADEFRGKRLPDFDPDFPADRLPELTERLRLSPKPLVVPTRQRRKDGTLLDMEVTVHLAQDEERSLLIGNMVDVTTRKRAQDAQVARSEHLSRLLGMAPVGVAISVDGVVRFANPRASELLDLGVGSLMASGFASSADWDDVVGQVAESGIARDRQLRMLGPEGEGRDILATFLRTEFEGGEGVLGWLIDIGTFKAAEAEMIRARRMAEDAARMKGDFLANMSHEIRTPMNAIVGMTHLALRTQLDARQRGYLTRIDRAAEGLLAVINDVLDFSKIEAGRLEMESIPFWVEDVFENVTNILGLRAEEKGLELVVDLPEDFPERLIGDPTRLGQVLLNLGSNGIKFTEHGGVVFGARLLTSKEGHAHLHFWVKDSGIGIPEEARARLFQSFTQADSSMTRKFGGTGLGLAISRSLVELMGGRIWVESEGQGGSTFHFTVLMQVESQACRRRMLRADEVTGMRVLVVDDNDYAREYLAGMVESLGLEAVPAESGERAIEAYRDACDGDRPFAAVLLDWKMPRMDGILCARQLGEASSRKVPTLIMVTAFGREEVQAAAEEERIRFSGILTKPVSPSTLMETIGEVLGIGGVVERSPLDRQEREDDRMRHLAGARLLVVEDNEMNQELTSELLREARIDVVLAGNGAEALQLLARDDRFDGILMDIQMPVMDGYTATRAIRKNPAWTEMPIIAMTAHAMKSDRERALEAGMSDHVAKPLDIRRMFETIGRWIRPRTSFAHRAEAVAPLPASSPPSLEELHPLPGIDARVGIRTAMGKQDLYRRLLHSFWRTQRNFASAFEAARVSNDVQAMRLLAHTLKGVAANVGARGVQESAAGLERAVVAEPESISLHAARSVAELQVVLDGLEARFGNPNPPRPAGPDTTRIDLAFVLDAATRLDGLLAASDAAATEVADEIGTSVRGTPVETAFGDVLRAVGDYDFDAARTALGRFVAGVEAMRPG